MLLKKIVIALLFLSPLSAFASAGVQATAQWEVRTTGNDANAGCWDGFVTSPGTDYSQQDSPQVTFTDLVIGATTTQLTSAAFPFSSVSPGNCIHITGGTGFTTGWYEIISVSGSTATMDRSVGTAASTGGAGKLGGGLLTLAGLNTAFQSNQTSNGTGNVVWIKSGTYTLTTSWTAPGQSVNFIGYASTHGDMGTRPLVTTATNSITNLFPLNNGNWRFDNINFSSTAGTPGRGFVATSVSDLAIFNSKLSGFTTPVNCDNNNGGYCNQLTLSNVEITGASVKAAVIANQTSYTWINDAYIHGGTVDAVSVTGSNGSGGSMTIINTIMAGNTGKCFNSVSGTTPMVLLQLTLKNITCYNPTGAGIDLSGQVVSATQSGQFIIENVIEYGATTYGYVGNNVSTFSPYANNLNAYVNKIAYGNNTTANTSNWFSTTTNAITLTADPFTNAAAGDFSLNNAAGGGALLRAAGYPGVFPGATTTGYIDVGAVQHADPVASGASNYGYTQ